MRCSIARKRCLRFSSTKRCIRKRCSTCGTGCRSTRSMRLRRIGRARTARRRGRSGSRFRPDARWRGARVPTEAEFQRAAYGDPETVAPHRERRDRAHPWGDDEPALDRGVFDFSSWDPEPAGSHPKGASAWGVDDLVGNGWEWTSTTFGPFPGFRTMASYPEYSADFFDGEHVVMKGASPATARELLRPTFRNWFRTRYPYVYSTFRRAA